MNFCGISAEQYKTTPHLRCVYLNLCLQFDNVTSRSRQSCLSRQQQHRENGCESPLCVVTSGWLPGWWYDQSLVSCSRCIGSWYPVCESVMMTLDWNTNTGSVLHLWQAGLGSTPPGPARAPRPGLSLEMCSNEDVNWDLPCLPGMHTNQPVCVRSHENVSGVVFSGYFNSLHVVCIWTNLDFFTPVTTCHNCSVCHESWQARVTMSWGDLSSGMEIGEKPWLWSDPQFDSWDEQRLRWWWHAGVILSAVAPA